MEWVKVTDVILGASIMVLLVFAGLGIWQWVSRKSLWKVDRNLLMFVPVMVLLAVIYVVFDKFIILSVRPDGSGEPSFPSSHAMIVSTIFFLTMLNLKKYVKQKSLRVILYVVMMLLIVLVCVGRVASEKHWATDVVCGVVFALVFTGIYYLLVKKVKIRQLPKKESKNE